MAKVSRDDIIAAAIQLFNQNGYHATSMQDIARAVSIKKPSLYHHFESKEAILLAILETGMDKLIDTLESIHLSGESPVSKLKAAVRAHANAIAENPQGAAVFLREDRGLGSDYLDIYIAKRDHFEGLFRAIIQEGVAAGMFDTRDIAITSQALMGMVNWMTRWYRPQGRLSAVEVADLFTDQYLKGLIVSRDVYEENQGSQA